MKVRDGLFVVAEGEVRVDARREALLGSRGRRGGLPEGRSPCHEVGVLARLLDVEAAAVPEARRELVDDQRVSDGDTGSRR